MTDIETLFKYRIAQAEETIADAEKMLKDECSPRSIVNRAYYAMFYSVLALFLKTETNLKTSKHAGIISIFDKEFVHAGKIDTHYSKILHKTFELRQAGDYKELVELSHDEASQFVKFAVEFLAEMKRIIG